LAEFFSTTLLLGPLFVWALEMDALHAPGRVWLARVAVAGGAAQLVTQVLKFLWLSRSEQFELHGSALLLSGRLQNAFLTRLALLIVVGIAIPLNAHSGWAVATTLGLAVASEWLGRWLFFVSVVPKNIAAAFTRSGRAV
jgi:formate dehydrogenase iron-sulfur subunit